jgi:hypothetical protein
MIVLVTTPLMIPCADSPGASTAAPSSTPSDGTADPKADLVDIHTLGSTTIAAEPFADWLVAEPNGMWVANVDGGLVRLDLADGTKTAAVAVGEIPLPLEVAGGALRAARSEPSPEIIRVPLEDPTAAIHIALPLWASSPASAELVRLDPESPPSPRHPASSTVATSLPPPRRFGCGRLRNSLYRSIRRRTRWSPGSALPRAVAASPWAAGRSGRRLTTSTPSSGSRSEHHE